MSDTRPVISVLMPSYNGESFLAMALESLANQTLHEFELVIRDDGSKDRTLRLIESFKDARFRLLDKPSPRHGLFPNLNTILKEARAPLCQILCQDDFLEPDALKEIVNFWNGHPQIELLFTKNRMMDWEGNLGEPPRLDDLPSVLSSSLAAQHFFFHGCIPGNLSTVSFRTASAWALGGFDTNLTVSGDYDLWARLIQTGAMGILQKPLVRIRSHKGQLSRQSDSAPLFASENRKIRNELIKSLPQTIQGPAKAFEQRRHFVLDFHMALRAILRGEGKNALAIWRAIGSKDLFPAAYFWLITVNNRRRPTAPFLIPEEDLVAIRTLADKASHNS